MLVANIFLKITDKPPVAVAHTYNPRTQEAETRELTRVTEQHILQYDSCLKN